MRILLIALILSACQTTTYMSTKRTAEISMHRPPEGTKQKGSIKTDWFEHYLFLGLVPISADQAIDTRLGRMLGPDEGCYNLEITNHVSAIGVIGRFFLAGLTGGVLPIIYDFRQSEVKCDVAVKVSPTPSPAPELSPSPMPSPSPTVGE